MNQQGACTSRRHARANQNSRKLLKCRQKRQTRRAGLTFSLWKCYPKCSVSSSHSCSSPSEELCVCVMEVCVCVWFLLGRCFPILVNLHHSERRKSGAVSVMKCRHCGGRAGAPGVSYDAAGGWGLWLLAAPTCVFWGNETRHLLLWSLSDDPQYSSCSWKANVSLHSTFCWSPPNNDQRVRDGEEKSSEDFVNCGNSYVITPRYSANHLEAVPN